MATFYIDQTVPNGTAGGTVTAYTTVNVVPTKANGDVWLFPNGGRKFFCTSPGITTYIFDIRDFNIRTGCYDVLTGVEVVDQPDVELCRKQEEWPSEEIILRKYALLDGGVDIRASIPQATYSLSRGVNAGGTTGLSILQGLCIQNCWQSGIEFSSNNGRLTVQKCMLRKISVNGFSTPFGGNSLRVTATTNGVTCTDTFILNEGEDAVWAAAGTVGNVFKRMWVRTISIPPSLPSTSHTDAFQMLTADGLVMDKVYVDHFAQDEPASDRLPRIGSCLITDTIGSVACYITNCIFRTNFSAVNLQQANVTLQGNRMYQGQMFDTSRSLGAMPDMITIGAGGHTIRGNLFVMGEGIQGGAQGFMFAGGTNKIGTSLVEFNTFVGNKQLAPNGCFQGGGAGVASTIFRNNFFLNFERAIACNPAPAVEQYNHFFNVAMRVTISYTGGVEASLGTGSKTVLATDFDPKTYRPIRGGTMARTGQHNLYWKDLDGKQRYNPPTPGAFEAF